MTLFRKPPQRERGYFHEDENLDRLYRLIELQDHTINSVGFIASCAFVLAVVALLVALPW